MDVNQIQQLTDAAFKYGPFFFSILFVIFLTRWSYKKYDTAITRNPPIPASDVVLNRWMFGVTFVFGLILVIISIVWWWWFQPSIYFFKGEIRNLQPQEEIAADSYYLRQELRSAIGDITAGLLRNEHFLIMQTHPFKSGDRFQLDYSKDHKRSTQLWITYTPAEDEPIFDIVYDPVKQSSSLQVEAVAAQKQTSFLGWYSPRVVEAAIRSTLNPMLSADAHEDMVTNVIARALDILRDSRADVGTKLDSIDALNRFSTDELETMFRASFPEQPALTIFDLTQHSDQELAAKATALAKRIDIDGHLTSQLSSSVSPTRISAEKVLLRISRSHALALLAKVNTTRFPDLAQTKDKVEQGKEVQVLKPTASAQGDRYYMKINWDPAQADAVSCITKYLNASLITNRTLKQEQSTMAGKSQRYVYWYDKDWVLQTGTAMRRCGGNVEYVHPY